MIRNGPPSYSNWQAFTEGKKLQGISEFPLYTDAQITGMNTEDFGPYKFLNTVPMENAPGVLQPTIVLRVDYHLENFIPDMTNTDASNYHGGGLHDEIAALVSLCMGVRVKSGDVSRKFYPNDDPLGMPQSFRYKKEPTLMLDAKWLKLPNAVGAHALEKIAPLKILPNLSKEEVVAVIRAARLYQDALWIGESEPALAWVMFVSAIEAAANAWQKTEDSPVDKLKVRNPEFYTMLEDTGVENLPELVAKEFMDSLGVTTKFVNFVIRFLPDPPQHRPTAWGQVEWSNKKMKKALKKIYGYRSKALHCGIPFPAPMCQTEHVLNGYMAEKPTGLACYTSGGTWLADDTPMLLHVFEYITRGALLNWLDSLAKK